MAKGKGNCDPMMGAKASTPGSHKVKPNLIKENSEKSTMNSNWPHKGKK